jgi:hypothetical protein
MPYPAPDEKGYPFNPFQADTTVKPQHTIPDYKEEDRKMKEELKGKYEKVKTESIKKSTENFYRRFNMFKLIASIVTLIIAFLFAFIFPGAGWETLVITLVAGLAAQVGITNWRSQYEMAKNWFKSKTLVGSLLVVVPLILIAVMNFFSFGLPSWVLQILTWLLTVGGGTALSGIIDATTKNTKQLPAGAAGSSGTVKRN